MSDHVVEGIELRSTFGEDGKFRLTLERIGLSAPGPDEVIVRIEATPVNPSDMGQLLGRSDLTTLEIAETPNGTALTAHVPEASRKSLRTRIDKPLTVGNEGAGTVVFAGENAQALLGKLVAVTGGGMYTQYRKLPKAGCMVLPQGTEAADGAAISVNPMTALTMVETMRLEGHSALVHTAAASNLGLMLNRICLADGIALVNIVRSPSQVAQLKAQGATFIVDSSADTFQQDLTNAVAETGATIAFDAVGGGSLANNILHAMEDAINRSATVFDRYGSTVLKQIYIYGDLDATPTILDRSYGMAWNVGAYLVTPYLRKLGREGVTRLRSRVLNELKTTFASRYSTTIALHDLLKPDVIRAIAKRATGDKYLIHLD